MSNELPQLSLEKKFSVEHGYNICLIFYHCVWPSVQPKLPELSQDSAIVHDLFFTSICLGFECSAHWFEAVSRITHVPRINQKELLLTEEEICRCTIEFCKICKEMYEWDLGYILNLLDAMESNPQTHSYEWTLWKKAIGESIFYTFYHLEWNAEFYGGIKSLISSTTDPSTDFIMECICKVKMTKIKRMKNVFKLEFGCVKLPRFNDVFEKK